MADRATVISNLEEFPATESLEDAAEAIFAKNKGLIERGEAFDTLQIAIEDEHDMMTKKYDALDRRLKKVEGRGTFLASASDEKIFMYLAAAYFLIVFFLPAVREFLIPTLRDVLEEK